MTAPLRVTRTRGLDGSAPFRLAWSARFELQGSGDEDQWVFLFYHPGLKGRKSWSSSPILNSARRRGIIVWQGKESEDRTDEVKSGRMGRGKGSVDIILVWVMMLTSPSIQSCDKQDVSGTRAIYSTWSTHYRHYRRAWSCYDYRSIESRTDARQNFCVDIESSRSLNERTKFMSIVSLLNDLLLKGKKEGREV
jgi:hypothetical protein